MIGSPARYLPSRGRTCSTAPGWSRPSAIRSGVRRMGRPSPPPPLCSPACRQGGGWSARRSRWNSPMA
jgi:hypothetical protein